MAQKIVTFEVAMALKEAGYPQELPCALTRPTYLNAWLWLWREKKECINIMTDIHGDCRSVCNNGDVMPKYADPEEAIAKAIDYLVENNLIK